MGTTYTSRPYEEGKNWYENWNLYRLNMDTGEYELVCDEYMFCFINVRNGKVIFRQMPDFFTYYMLDLSDMSHKMLPFNTSSQIVSWWGDDLYINLLLSENESKLYGGSYGFFRVSTITWEMEYVC